MVKWYQGVRSSELKINYFYTIDFNALNGSRKTFWRIEICDSNDLESGIFQKSFVWGLKRFINIAIESSKFASDLLVLIQGSPEALKVLESFSRISLEFTQVHGICQLTLAPVLTGFHLELNRLCLIWKKYPLNPIHWKVLAFYENLKIFTENYKIVLFSSFWIYLTIWPFWPFLTIHLLNRLWLILKMYPRNPIQRKVLPMRIWPFLTKNTKNVSF